MVQRQFVLGVDLDGVCADFYNGMRPIAEEWLGLPSGTLPEKVSYGLPEWGIDTAPGGYAALHKFAVTQRDLFRKLVPISGAPQTLRKLSEKEVRIRIITHRLFIKYFHQKAVSQTIEWLDNWDIPYSDLCLLKDKTAVGAHLYLEDSPANIVALQDEGCDVIIFENTTNLESIGKRAKDWTEVFGHVTNAIEKWKAQQD